MGSGHQHGFARPGDSRPLATALVLICAFMLAEVVVGMLAHSLALLSDAAHMLTDAAAIALALVAIRLARRPTKGAFTFGLRRAEILSAQANGLTLLLLAVWLSYEAARRLLTPPPVDGAAVLIVALLGVAVNLVATWIIGRANRSSLNVEGAFQHILTDLFGFLATAAAGAAVLATGFARADAIATLIVVALMVRAGVRLVRDSGRVFLEAAPSDVDPDMLGDRLVTVPRVVEIHDLHVWQITSGRTALSAHVLVERGSDCHALRRDLEHLLADRYAITHTTLQVDHAAAAAAPADAGASLPLATDDRRDHCADTHGPIHRPGPHPH